MSRLQAAWRGSYDVAAISILLGLGWVAFFFFPRGTVLFGVPGLYEAIFLVAWTLLDLWLGFRLWVLARYDCGPSTLLLVAFCSSLLYVAYSLLTRGELPQGSPDAVATAIRWIGATTLAVGVLRWKRLPPWLGWTYLAVPALEIVEVMAQRYTGIVLVTVVYLLNTVLAFGLGVAFLRRLMVGAVVLGCLEQAPQPDAQ